MVAWQNFTGRGPGGDWLALVDGGPRPAPCLRAQLPLKVMGGVAWGRVWKPWGSVMQVIILWRPVKCRGNYVRGNAFW